MTPAQIEHLKLIDAHLERLLAIAEKRTPGEWLPDSEEGLVTFVSHESELGFDITPIAEPGWRAIRKTINNIFQFEEWLAKDDKSNLVLWQQIEGISYTLAKPILTKFPLESLT